MTRYVANNSHTILCKCAFVASESQHEGIATSLLASRTDDASERLSVAGVSVKRSLNSSGLTLLVG